MKLTIDSIAFGGEGVARDNGKVYFVPFTAPQEQIEATVTESKKNFCRAKLDQIIIPGPDRTSPQCPHFTVCGGCQLQHLTYPAQLQAKQSIVEQTLKRIGKLPLPPLSPIVAASNTWNYRRHVTLHIENNQIGYHKAHSHELLPITTCPIFAKSLSDFLPQLQQLLKLFNPLPPTCRLFAEPDGKFLVALFAPIPKITPEDLQPFTLLSSLAIRNRNEEQIFGTPHLTFSISDKTVHYSPFSFVQNHPEMSEKLYLSLASKIPGHHPLLLDLYSGIGVTSLILSDKFDKILAIENNPHATKLAKHNFQINNVSHAKALQARAETILPTHLKKKSTLLVNPPRTGLDPAILTAIKQTPPKEIFYISCMPATLARDLSQLASHYTIESIQPFDLFPQTTHVETLVHLKQTP